MDCQHRMLKDYNILQIPDSVDSPSQSQVVPPILKIVDAGLVVSVSTIVNLYVTPGTEPAGPLKINLDCKNSGVLGSFGSWNHYHHQICIVVLVISIICKRTSYPSVALENL